MHPPEPLVVGPHTFAPLVCDFFGCRSFCPCVAGSMRRGACALHTRCVHWDCCVDRFSQFRGYVLSAPMILPKTVPDNAEGIWAV